MDIILKHFQLGTANIKAKIEVDGIAYEETCVVIVEDSRNLELFSYMRALNITPDDFRMENRF